MRLPRPSPDDNQNLVNVGNREVDRPGCLALARPIRESFILVDQPYLPPANGLNRIMVKSIPHSELKYILPDSKVLTYALGLE